jgi:hypothetical protein
MASKSSKGGSSAAAAAAAAATTAAAAAAAAQDDEILLVEGETGESPGAFDRSYWNAIYTTTGLVFDLADAQGIGAPPAPLTPPEVRTYNRFFLHAAHNPLALGVLAKPGHPTSEPLQSWTRALTDPDLGDIHEIIAHMGGAPLRLPFGPAPPAPSSGSGAAAAGAGAGAHWRAPPPRAAVRLLRAVTPASAAAIPPHLLLTPQDGTPQHPSALHAGAFVPIPVVPWELLDMTDADIAAAQALLSAAPALPRCTQLQRAADALQLAGELLTEARAVCVLGRAADDVKAVQALLDANPGEHTYTVHGDLRLTALALKLTEHGAESDLANSLFTGALQLQRNGEELTWLRKWVSNTFGGVGGEGGGKDTTNLILVRGFPRRVCARVCVCVRACRACVCVSSAHYALERVCWRYCPLAALSLPSTSYPQTPAPLRLSP